MKLFAKTACTLTITLEGLCNQTGVSVRMPLSSPLLALALFASTHGAQVQAQNATASLPSVPTTKILAVGTLAAPLTEDVRKGTMPQEVADTVRLYLGGKIDQWYLRKDGKGVVFLLNLTSVEEAHTLLEGLPLGRAKKMSFELMELGPLSPLGLLLGSK
jgi:hypothetical protein